MAMKTMDDLFVDTLKDVYYAEKQILKALPQMARKAENENLKHLLEQHFKETEQQVVRIEEAFKVLDMPARSKKCEAIEGLIGEAKDQMDHIDEEHVLDAAIISSAQAVEHYEISRYGTLIEWAKDLGHQEVVRLLEETLEEEKKADRLLTECARGGVNKEAEQAA